MQEHSPPHTDDQRRLRAPRGFTLLEVMVSGGLLLIGLSSVIGLVTSMTGFKEHQQHLTQVMHIAEGTLEEMLLYPSSHADLSAGSHGTNPPSDPPRYFNSSGQRQTTFGMYSVTWNVTAASPVAGMRRIDLTVKWTESWRQKQYVLTTWRQ